MLDFFLDLIFPPACVTCDSIGGYICGKCYQNMHFYTQPVEIDLPKPSLDKLFSCTTYAKTGGDFIRTYKFEGAFALAPIISEIMKENMLKPEVDVLIPVPLHTRRQRQRGFNQAERLAKNLSNRWKIPMHKALLRTKATTPQAELDRANRLTHLKNVFVLDPKISVAGKTIAIIDDVATTGTTLNECAKVLKKHKAKKVIGIVFAHG